MADHNSSTLNPATLSVVTAASKVGGNVTVLVAGKSCSAVCDAVKSVKGVNAVLHADDDKFAHQLPENLASLV